MKNRIDLEFQKYLDSEEEINQIERQEALTINEKFIKNVDRILDLNVTQLKVEKCALSELKNDCYFVHENSVPFKNIQAVLIITNWFLDEKEKDFIKYYSNLKIHF